jgi:hypothetical protein
MAHKGGSQKNRVLNFLELLPSDFLARRRRIRIAKLRSGLINRTSFREHLPCQKGKPFPSFA